MTTLNSHNEVADFQDVSQFAANRSEFKCAEYACATVKCAGQPGKGATGTVAQVDALADSLYTKYIGPDVISDEAGTTNDQIHTMLNFLGLPYQDITAINPNSQQASDISHIKAALAQGYPIVAVITEVSAFDLDLGRNPYSWGPAGTHAIVYTGIAPDGNLLVRDSANIIGPLQVNNTVRPGPRRYDINRIGTQWATQVKLPWLPMFGGSTTPQTQLTITEMLNNNAFPNRGGHTPQWVILHGTAGGSSAQNIAAYFKSTEGTNNPVSAHYVIGQDGTIVRCNKESDGAWANGGISAGHDPWWTGSVNPNNVTISIEHVKPSTDNSDQLTPAQKQASFALIKDICTRNHIKAGPANASGGITGHYSIDPVNRSHCPGPYPWAELWTYLSSTNGGSGHMGVPANWKDDGTTLTAPNGKTVTQGFRDFILTHAWDTGNWPLEEAHGQNPVENSNPTLGGGTQQVYRWAVLEWTPKMGVFVAWCGQEFLWQRQQIATLEQQVKDLQAKLATPTPVPAPPVELADYADRLHQIEAIAKI